MRSALADFAAALGVPCFPCDGNKRPFEEGGFHTATTDLAEIDRRFSDERAKMIGVPCGHATGWVVIDIDVKNGARGLEWFEEHQTRLPSTRTHRTATKGMHLVLRMPEGLEIRNSAVAHRARRGCPGRGRLRDRATIARLPPGGRC